MRGSPRVSSRVGLMLLCALTMVCATAFSSFPSRADDDPRADTPKNPAAKTSKKPKPARLKKPSAKSKKVAKNEVTQPAEAKVETSIAVAAAAEDDKTLKFTRDIAPILVANCINCHNPTQKRGKFDLTTFRKLIDGAEDGKVIVPGNTEESKLVEMIETREMPRGNRARLSDEAIAKIVAWVKAGALLDAGVDPNAPLDKIAAKPADLKKAALAKLNDDQRDKLTVDTGMERLKKAAKAAAPEVTPSAHFMLFSNLPKERREPLLKMLEARRETLKKLLGAAWDGAVDGKFKTSLYVFNDSNGYVEFARTNENREVEASTEGHSNLGVEEPYLAAIDPLNGRDDPFLNRKASRSKKRVEETGGPERTLAGLLIEQFAVGVVTKASPKAPRWLSLGLGAFMASQVEPASSAYLRKLRIQAFQQYELGWNSKSNLAIGDDLEEDKLRAVGFSLVEWMALEPSLRPMFPWFVGEMLQGQGRLDDVIEKGWGKAASRKGFLELWGAWIAAKYGRIR